MKAFPLYLMIILICVSNSPVYGDYVEVRRATRVKEEPTKGAATIEKVEPLTLMNLLNGSKQENGYYQVRAISTGEPAWIYRTFVRGYYGEMPEPTTEEKIIASLADPTLRLTEEERGYVARHLSIGKPQAVYERVREGYVVAQDGRLKVPLWVQYELSQEDLKGKVVRKDDFRADASIPFRYRAEIEDYEGSNFDQGHMAPAGDMKRSEKVMSESFLLSNMAPQVGEGFNQSIWRYLEAGVRGWVKEHGKLTVITGPVFAVDGDKVSYRVIGDNHTAVPTHFYKIVVDTNNPEVEALAFMMPNKDLSGKNYRDYIVTIDEIEKATGLDFLSALPVDVQEDVESQKAESVW